MSKRCRHDRGSSDHAHLGRVPRPRLYEQIALRLNERELAARLVRESRLESLAHIELVSDVAVLRDGDGPAA